MTTYYVRDRKQGGAIVNAIEAHNTPSLDHLVGSEDLYLDTNPPLSVLQAYRYWDERP